MPGGDGVPLRGQEQGVLDNTGASTPGRRNRACRSSKRETGSLLTSTILLGACLSPLSHVAWLAASLNPNTQKSATNSNSTTQSQSGTAGTHSVAVSPQTCTR